MAIRNSGEYQYVIELKGIERSMLSSERWLQGKDVKTKIRKLIDFQKCKLIHNNKELLDSDSLDLDLHSNSNTPIHVCLLNSQNNVSQSSNKPSTDQSNRTGLNNRFETKQLRTRSPVTCHNENKQKKRELITDVPMYFNHGPGLVENRGYDDVSKKYNYDAQHRVNRSESPFSSFAGVRRQLPELSTVDDPFENPNSYNNTSLYRSNTTIGACTGGATYNGFSTNNNYSGSFNDAASKESTITQKGTYKTVSLVTPEEVYQNQSANNGTHKERHEPTRKSFNVKSLQSSTIASTTNSNKVSSSKKWNDNQAISGSDASDNEKHTVLPRNTTENGCKSKYQKETSEYAISKIRQPTHSKKNTKIFAPVSSSDSNDEFNDDDIEIDDFDAKSECNRSSRKSRSPITSGKPLKSILSKSKSPFGKSTQNTPRGTVRFQDDQVHNCGSLSQDTIMENFTKNIRPLKDIKQQTPRNKPLINCDFSISDRKNVPEKKYARQRTTVMQKDRHEDHINGRLRVAEKNSTYDFEGNMVLVNIQTMQNVFQIKISAKAPLSELRRSLWTATKDYEDCTQGTHFWLLFTQRMHIFEDENIEKEPISHFLRLASSADDDDNRDVIHFYAFALEKAFHDGMYEYSTNDLCNLFIDSHWWKPQINMEQEAFSKTLLLSTLYIVHQYFRKPIQEEADLRRKLEPQFLNTIRKYCFRPAVLALKHMLLGEMFEFEKKILIDGLLTMLIKFCPLEIEEHRVGIFMPYLICWIFSRCDLKSEELDSCQTIVLTRQIDQYETRYFKNPVTSQRLSYKNRILYEIDEINDQNPFRHLDLYSLIRNISGQHFTGFQSTFKMNSYSIDLSSIFEIDDIERIDDDNINQLSETMLSKYQCFTIISRVNLAEKNLHDQLIMLKNRLIAVMLSRRQHIGINGSVDYNIDMFCPMKGTSKSKASLKDVYEIEPDRPDPRIPFFISEIMPTKIKPQPNSDKAIEQITMALLDVSQSMFDSHALNKPELPTLFELSKKVLVTLSYSLNHKNHPHAIGLILFGSDVHLACHPTRNPEIFEKEIHRIPLFRNHWSKMYDAMDVALNTIENYTKKNVMAKNYRSLIICISDGVDYKSQANPRQILQKIKFMQSKPVIDLVSFLPDTRHLETLEDRKRVNKMRRLCDETKGIIYVQKSDEVAELTIAFEEEAAWWLSKRQTMNRKEINAGRNRVDKLEHIVPDELFQTAEHVKPQRKTLKQVCVQDIEHRDSRIEAEANDIATQQIPGVHLFVNTTKNDFWKIILEGPHDSLYFGGLWLLYVTFPSQYPVLPPNIHFHTPIYHINFVENSDVCSEIYQYNWSTRTTMYKSLADIVSLLRHPNYEQPASPARAELYRNSKVEYQRHVTEWINKYARTSMTGLCLKYNLHPVDFNQFEYEEDYASEPSSPT